MWDPGEAVHWRKKAIELAEADYGKSDIRNVFYYDKLADDLYERGSYKEAIKWNKKSIKIKKKKGMSPF